MDAFTLDQFAVFVAVIDQGGFAAAARKLNRAQSAITYAIQKLEEQTGLALFDRSGYRPVLTEAGAALLPRARRVLDALVDYQQQARGIAGGLEAELSLVVDMLAPIAPLADALREMHMVFPTVQVRVVVESFGTTPQFLARGDADLALLPQTMALTDCESNRYGEVELVAVAAPAHPLAELPSPITSELLRDHVQLVLASKAAVQGEHASGVHATNRWYLTDLAAKRELLLAGAGWGSMPAHLVAEDLAAGRLVALEPDRWEGSDRMPAFAAVIAHRKDRALGPAGRWLFQRLASDASPIPQSDGRAVTSASPAAPAGSRGPSARAVTASPR
jgi:DNA-binding transcriptional LysR family regulator